MVLEPFLPATKSTTASSLSEEWYLKST